MTNKELEEIKNRCLAATAAPWVSYVEGRDHTSGSNFIKNGDEKYRRDDIELYGATVADQDFIAHARQDIPNLLNEIVKLKAMPKNRSIVAKKTFDLLRVIESQASYELEKIAKDSTVLNADAVLGHIELETDRVMEVAYAFFECRKDDVDISYWAQAKEFLAKSVYDNDIIMDWIGAKNKENSCKFFCSLVWWKAYELY